RFLALELAAFELRSFIDSKWNGPVFDSIRRRQPRLHRRRSRLDSVDTRRRRELARTAKQHRCSTVSPRVQRRARVGRGDRRHNPSHGERRGKVGAATLKRTKKTENESL